MMNAKNTMGTINMAKRKSRVKAMPFTSHKVRQTRKQATLAIFTLIFSLSLLIMFYSNIIDWGKNWLNTPTVTAADRAFASFENIEASFLLERQIKNDLEKAHKLIHQVKLPENHFHTSEINDLN